MGTLLKAIVAISGVVRSIGSIISSIKNKNRIKKDEKEEAELESIFAPSDNNSCNNNK